MNASAVMERRKGHSVKPFKIAYRFFFWGMIALIAGCAGGAHHSLVPDYKAKPPRSIAVLPVLNETVNLKAPNEFRSLVHQRIAMKGYETPAISHVDNRLQEKGIREAGQVNSLTPQEIGKFLGVDALLYTTVTEFNTTYLVAYSSMTVGARFELKDAKTGEKLWESDHQVKESKLGLDQKSMGDALKFAALQSYTPYCQRVTDACLATLPNGPLYTSPPQAGCLVPGGGK
jgi:hypothetical protein